MEFFEGLRCIFSFISPFTFLWLPYLNVLNCTYLNRISICQHAFKMSLALSTLPSTQRSTNIFCFFIDAQSKHDTKFFFQICKQTKINLFFKKHTCLFKYAHLQHILRSSLSKISQNNFRDINQFQLFCHCASINVYTVQLQDSQCLINLAHSQVYNCLSETYVNMLKVIFNLFEIDSEFYLVQRSNIWML